ncbi:MAG: type-F conjugative transfer system pilin assembly protein TrbC [Candidatus Thiodiazotropha sp.]
MLCQQLTLSLGLLLAFSPVFASDTESRIRELDSAEAAVSATQVETSRAVDEAAESMAGDSAFRQEAQRLEDLAPAPFGSLDGIKGVKPGIDLDALMARYGSPAPELTASDSDERLLIFISASMPQASLKKLARQAAHVKAPLILRGFIEGNLDATARFMSDILGDGEPSAHALIDPRLFDRFDVKQVPAVVLVPDGACVAGVQTCPKTTLAHVHVAGDVTLDYALEHIARTRPEAREIAESLHALLRGAL